MWRGGRVTRSKETVLRRVVGALILVVALLMAVRYLPVRAELRDKLCELGLPVNPTIPLSAWWKFRADSGACIKFGPLQRVSGVFVINSDPFFGGSAFYPYRFVEEAFVSDERDVGPNGAALSFLHKSPELERYLKAGYSQGKGIKIAITFDGRWAAEPITAGHGGSQYRAILVERMTGFGPAPQPTDEDWDRWRNSAH